MRETIKKFLFSVLLLAASQSVSANGCTGSWFSMVYSPWCNCWQVCGNYISDCDEVVSISWNFGDGTTAQGENPCHQFPGPGTYTVTMTIVHIAIIRFSIYLPAHATLLNRWWCRSTIFHLPQILLQTLPASVLPLSSLIRQLGPEVITHIHGFFLMAPPVMQ
ncbi:MAG: PKD domain-containing protein [Bacteroidetes bacterium]|nr:PKD domain-containing protein [Bacteroidota bacterium]